jgi:hypothetical protein
MTTRAEIITQATAICEQFQASLTAPMVLVPQSSYSDEMNFQFKPSSDAGSWENHCSINVSFGYQAREHSDDVGFYTEQTVCINFRANSMSGSTYSAVQPKVAAYNKAVEFMALLVAALPEQITERTATHAERAEENKILAATNYCRPIVGNNCKNMRVEGAKCLPVAPETVRRGEYTISRDGKKFTVTLTDQHTLLVRTY